jgi:limonene-1,2-epoxide hydrolase
LFTATAITEEDRMSTRARLGDFTDCERVVGDFCEAWKAVDREAIVATLADDAVYQSGPFPEVRGRDAIGALLRRMTRNLTECDFEIVHIASDDTVVFTERADLVVTTCSRAVLPVVGVFEVQAGRISAWREYFDLDQHMKLMGTTISPPAESR